MRTVHVEPRYLVGESLRHLVDFLQSKPLLGSVLLLGVFGGVLGLLRWRFQRAATFDVVVFTCIVTVILVWLASILYTYLHYPGFRFGG